jgi:hypothetical protein
MIPGEDSFNPSMAWLKQQASKLAKQQQQQAGGSSRDQPAAAKAAVATAAAVAAKNGTTAQIAAVTNPDFLVPTDPDYTGEGRFPQLGWVSVRFTGCQLAQLCSPSYLCT